eukprot:737620-Amphidinium_carterae.1
MWWTMPLIPGLLASDDEIPHTFLTPPLFLLSRRWVKSPGARAGAVLTSCSRTGTRNKEHTIA